MTELTGTTVARSVEVDAVVERAFDVFTHMTAWWPPVHRIVGVDLREVVIEPAVDGCCYQIGVDGSRCDWGRVMVWDPPWRLQIAWHLNSRFEFDADPGRASEVEVTFTSLANGRTRVDLEHRRFDRHGPDGDGLRSAVDAPDGWGYVIGRYRSAVHPGTPGRSRTMDTQVLRDAYDEFHTAAALTHAAPTDASWSAELVIAHIALTDELLATTARALLDGRPAAYDNAAASFRPNLEHHIDTLDDRDQQLADARRRSQQLCALAEQLDDTTAASAVHVRVIDGATVTVDQTVPFATALDVHATIHLPTHTSDLIALAIPDPTVHRP